MRNHAGWGEIEGALGPAERETLSALLEVALGVRPAYKAPVPLSEIEMPQSRLGRLPAALEGIAARDSFSRALHSYGRSFPELVRARAGDFSDAVDAVLYPSDETEVAEVLDFAARASAAVVPFGGGSSVVGGIGPLPHHDHALVLSLDTGRLDTVAEVDPLSQTARLGAGLLGPALEGSLRPHGFTLRHFPQSFEFSSLGGWIATRSGGHFAVGTTHIEDFVSGLTLVSPAGELKTRPLPASGAGPALERMLAGSEGTFGVITEAVMKVAARPAYRASESVAFPSMETALGALAELVRSRLNPANCRVLDEAESLRSALGANVRMLVAFESPNVPVDALLSVALDLLSAHGGRREAEEGRGERSEAADKWRSSFIRAPYYADAIIGMGLVVETFETSVSYAGFPALDQATRAAIARVERARGARGFVSCRVTHAYSDGLAPYYTVIASPGIAEPLSFWAELKEAVTTAFVENGGAVTHHHGVGRYHRSAFEQSVGDQGRAALGALRRHFDPKGLMNPGVLLG